MEQGQSRRKWYQIPLVVVVFGVFAITAWLYFRMFHSVNSENVEAFVRGFGAWAPVAYTVIYVVSAPIPFMTVVLSPISGLLFGTLWGSVLVICIATFSSLIPFNLARQLGREWVESKIKGERLQEIYARSEGQGGFVFILMLRLVPVLPWEIQNYVAGLTKVRLATYLIATPLGIIPGSVALVLLGASVTDPTSWQFAVAIAMNVVVMVGAPLIATFVRRLRRKQKDTDPSDPA